MIAAALFLAAQVEVRFQPKCQAESRTALVVLAETAPADAMKEQVVAENPSQNLVIQGIFIRGSD
jgi:hypothetical protein